MGAKCSGKSDRTGKLGDVDETATDLMGKVQFKKQYIGLMYADANYKRVLALANASMTEEIKKEVENGFPINYSLNKKGWTLLHSAAFTGDLSTLSYIIKEGGDLNR
jgi:ankyrin repeat protein